MNSSSGYCLEPGCFELLRVKGPDSARFLQGQVTCDINVLKSWASMPGAVCTNKGRVIAIFTLCRLDDDFALIMASGLAEPLRLHLDKYRPFYKCTLEKEDVALTGLCFGDAAPQIPLPSNSELLNVDDGWVCAIPGKVPRVIHVAADAVPTGWLSTAKTGLSQASFSSWEADDMKSGVFPFSGPDIEKYTPQEIHLDRRDFVSFSKGCYTGQEIVARMHYKSKPKKQLYLISLDLEPGENPPPELQILSTSGELLGSSIKALPTRSGGLLALAQLPLLTDADATALSSTSGKHLQVQEF